MAECLQSAAPSLVRVALVAAAVHCFLVGRLQSRMTRQDRGGGPFWYVHACTRGTSLHTEGRGAASLPLMAWADAFVTGPA